MHNSNKTYLVSTCWQAVSFRWFLLTVCMVLTCSSSPQSVGPLDLELFVLVVLFWVVPGRFCPAAVALHRNVERLFIDQNFILDRLLAYVLQVQAMCNCKCAKNIAYKSDFINNFYKGKKIRLTHCQKNISQLFIIQ